MKFLNAVILIALISSCATSNKLSKEAMEVTVISGKAPSHCSALGKVMGNNKEGIEELAKNQAKNATAKLGGDSLFIKEIIPNGNKIVLHGIAYKCN